MIYINSQLVAFFLIALAVCFLLAVFLYNRLQLALLARKTKKVIEAQYERDLREKMLESNEEFDQDYYDLVICKGKDLPSTQSRVEEDAQTSSRPVLKVSTEQQSD